MFIIILISIWFVNSATNINFNENSKLDSCNIKIGQQYNVVQYIENGNFNVNLEDVDTSKYITAEVTIIYPEENIDLKLSCTKISLNNIDQYIDQNGYALQKKQHIITLFPNTYHTTDRLSFSIDIKSDHLPHQYLLSIKNTENYQCVNDCNSGECSQSNQMCLCPQDYLDFDCSVYGVSLTLDKVISFTIDRYIYFQKNSDINKIQLQFETNVLYSNKQVDMTFQILFENFDYGLPSSRFSDTQISYYSSGQKQNVTLDLSTLQYNQRLQRYPRVIIKAESKYPFYGFIYVQVKQIGQSETDYKLMFSLLGAGALLLVIVIIFIIRCRYIRQKQKRQEDLKLNNQHFIPSAPYKEIVDKLKEQNPDIKTNEQCSVCLLEYQLISFCRITPCYHIFHANCLNQWLEKYENCPLCREELSLEALKGNKKTILSMQN